MFPVFFYWWNMIEILNFKCASEVALNNLPVEPYFVVISTDFQKMAPNEMHEVAELLVKTSAMWVAAHGNQATLFDDAVDFAFVQREIAVDKELPMVMTTCHDGDTMQEVISFLETATPTDEWGVDSWPIIVLRFGHQSN